MSQYPIDLLVRTFEPGRHIRAGRIARVTATVMRRISCESRRTPPWRHVVDLDEFLPPDLGWAPRMAMSLSVGVMLGLFAAEAVRSPPGPQTAIEPVVAATPISPIGK